ncbi:hypothetical protein CC86DRAFT_370692 [Ophiobolus disseminans]|uniref:Uncharacterized protein n=1 Tax=Ophiobolus disseminans TaxID=1469910 RepID=A0A6A6ZXN3_9PLEO|nr:hypothetical protein CC86DRAFT_370692 [Ophiobolus disseminans]
MEDDAIAVRIVLIMKHLLAVEANAFSGTEYSTTTNASDAAAAECHEGYVYGEKAYKIRIPYFGTIDLQPKPTPSSHFPQSGSTMPTDIPALINDAVGSNQATLLNGDNQWSHQPQSSFAGTETYNYNAHGLGNFDTLDDWTLQSINDSLFDSLFSGVDDQNLAFNMLNC